MKNSRKILVLMLLTVFLSINAVSAQTIDDRYVGGLKLPNWDNSYDVIGDPSVFDVSKVMISTNEFGYIFDIHTFFGSYLGLQEAGGIELGDLFFSTTGWNPYGDSPYREDTADNGEEWEFALILDSHSALSGTWSLYSVYREGIILSDTAMSSIGVSSGFRRNQEVQYAPTNGQVSLGTGNWSVASNYIRFEIAYEFFGEKYMELNGSTEYGFHWGMTCGNDVIEGSFDPVPEPTTIMLLGSGLMLLGVFRWRKQGRK